MLQEMVEKIKNEDVKRIIDYISVVASMKENHSDIMDNVTSFTVQPYTPTNDDLVTVYVFYRQEINFDDPEHDIEYKKRHMKKYLESKGKIKSYHSKSLPCTFSSSDYFRWHRIRDRRIKIEKIRYEHLVD